MASLSLNSLKQLMQAMVDTPGFDRVLSKVSPTELYENGNLSSISDKLYALLRYLTSLPFSHWRPFSSVVVGQCFFLSLNHVV